MKPRERPGSTAGSPTSGIARGSAMVTIRRILCPLDFSRFSRHALEQAVSLAREFGAEISALHVHAVAPMAQLVGAGAAPGVVPTRLPPSVRTALLSELHELANQVEAAGVTVRTGIEEGNPVAAIVQ